MGRKGINREIIVKATVDIIEKKGVQEFSLRSLAGVLGIKTASLYNHIDNIDDLFYETGVYALKALENHLRAGADGKTRDEALRSLAYAYLDFAHAHKNLYDFIMYIRTRGHVGVDEFVSSANAPVAEALAMYSLTPVQRVHRHRLFRSILHGFITQERAGFFTYSSESLRKSYEVAINCFLNDVHSAEKNKAM